MSNKNEWWEEILQPQKPRPKGAFTIKEVVAKTGINPRTLTSRLNDQVRRGNIIKGKCVDDGSVCNYYLPNPKKK